MPAKQACATFTAMKRLLPLLLFPLVAFAQEPVHTVFLVGDAGKSATPGASLRFLDEQIAKAPKGTILFLGDNIYPSGLHLSKTPGDTTESERNLLCQLGVVKDYPGNVFFVPGNHDWDEGKAGGLKAVNAEKKYIDTYLATQSVAANKATGGYLPKPGLPGPESFLLAPGVRMICLDTQWFLHFYKKDKLNGKTRKQTAEAFYHNLDSILNYCQTHNERAMVAYHHPLFTNGGHGAAKQPLRFLVNCTPLQVLGLIGGNRYFVQDIPQPRFKRMRKQMLAIMAKYKGVINVSGHEHYLQHFQDGDDYFIVSGSGSKLSHRKIKKYKELFYEDQQPGFAKLMFYADGKVVVEYWGANSQTLLKSFTLD